MNAPLAETGVTRHDEIVIEMIAIAFIVDWFMIVAKFQISTLISGVYFVDEVPMAIRIERHQLCCGVVNAVAVVLLRG